MLFRKMQVLRGFHGHRNLRAQSFRTVNVLLADAAFSFVVEKAKNTEHTAIARKQRHAQVLLDSII